MVKGTSLVNQKELDLRISQLPNVGVDFTHRWTLLERLYVDRSDNVSFIYDENILRWVLSERMDGGETFHLERDAITLQRYTDYDRWGLVGLSDVNLNDKTAVIVEGVSDFLIMHYLFPELNILGTTRLTGSMLSKYILIHFFNKIFICSDNDSFASRNTGLESSMKLSTFLNSYNIETSILLLPEKDVLNYVFMSYKLKYSL